MFSQLKEEAKIGGGFPPEQACCVGGLITARFGEVRRQEQHGLCWMEKGGGHAEGRMASGSISLGVRNDS